MAKKGKYIYLTRNNSHIHLPRKVWVRYGKKDENNIQWGDWIKKECFFDNNANPNGEAGIRLKNGFGFAGYNCRKKIWTRYRGDEYFVNGCIVSKIRFEPD